jgi:hypothetical protein
MERIQTLSHINEFPHHFHITPPFSHNLLNLTFPEIGNPNRDNVVHQRTTVIRPIERRSLNTYFDPEKRISTRTNLLGKLNTTENGTTNTTIIVALKFHTLMVELERCSVTREKRARTTIFLRMPTRIDSLIHRPEIITHESMRTKVIDICPVKTTNFPGRSIRQPAIKVTAQVKDHPDKRLTYGGRTTPDVMTNHSLMYGALNL